MTSYAPQVQTNRDPKWYGNLLRFATYDEAMENVRALMWRWTMVDEVRVIETDDPVNSVWRAGKTEKLEAAGDQEDNSQREMGDVP